MKKKKTDLRTLCANRITASEFNRLHETLGATKTLLSRVFNRPARAPHDMVIKLAVVLEVTPVFLINECGLGVDNITISQYEKLALVNQNT